MHGKRMVFYPCPPASTSSDMTQPAGSINLITTRHMPKTVIHNNDVAYNAAEMQTKNIDMDAK
jgi:hypothetical protein